MTRIIHPDTEVTVQAIARRLGAELPRFTRASRPETWQCWADRILQAARNSELGLDPAPSIAEAERYSGNETEEVRILRTAERLGIPRPMQRQAEAPEVWSWWAETVRTAEVVASAGGDISSLRRRALKLDGSQTPWPVEDHAPEAPSAS